jgi:hypothetical protein
VRWTNTSGVAKTVTRAVLAGFIIDSSYTSANTSTDAKVNQTLTAVNTITAKLPSTTYIAGQNTNSTDATAGQSAQATAANLALVPTAGNAVDFNAKQKASISTAVPADTSKKYCSASLGNDANPGTFAAPFLTLAAAYAGSTVGAEIVLMDGSILTASPVSNLSIYNRKITSTGGYITVAAARKLYIHNGASVYGVYIDGSPGTVLIYGNKVIVEKCVINLGALDTVSNSIIKDNLFIAYSTYMTGPGTNNYIKGNVIQGDLTDPLSPGIAWFLIDNIITGSFQTHSSDTGAMTDNRIGDFANLRTVLAPYANNVIQGVVHLPPTTGQNNEQWATSTSVPSVVSIVNGVWDEPQSNHKTKGTFGKLFQIIKNLLQGLQ